MRDVVGVACNKNGVPLRPDDNIEHPQSGLPLHDMTGGNAWISYVLASTVPGSPNYDAANETLLNQGRDILTPDLTQGEGIDPEALLAGVDRAKQQLLLASTIKDLSYDSTASVYLRLEQGLCEAAPACYFIDFKAHQKRRGLSKNPPKSASCLPPLSAKT